mmetsp:Transcript_58420/g.156169  ORF Transcript_58420/g.156169 Transcript_58420/m.156169 type:complete len:221 (-) Transcript_58420:310-972(-)
MPLQLHPSAAWLIVHWETSKQRERFVHCACGRPDECFRLNNPVGAMQLLQTGGAAWRQVRGHWELQNSDGCLQRLVQLMPFVLLGVRQSGHAWCCACSPPRFPRSTPHAGHEALGFPAVAASDHRLVRLQKSVEHVVCTGGLAGRCCCRRGPVHGRRIVEGRGQTFLGQDSSLARGFCCVLGPWPELFTSRWLGGGFTQLFRSVGIGAALPSRAPAVIPP